MNNGLKNLGLSAVNIMEPFEILAKDMWAGAKNIKDEFSTSVKDFVGYVRDKTLNILSLGVFGNESTVENARGGMSNVYKSAA